MKPQYSVQPVMRLQIDTEEDWNRKLITDFLRHWFGIDRAKSPENFVTGARQGYTNVGTNRDLLSNWRVCIGWHFVGTRSDSRALAGDHSRAKRICPSEYIARGNVITMIVGI
jgi:hypothetical protein